MSNVSPQPKGHGIPLKLYPAVCTCIGSARHICILRNRIYPVPGGVSYPVLEHIEFRDGFTRLGILCDYVK